MMHKKLDRTIFLGVLTCLMLLLVVSLSIALTQPYFGNMDDSNFLMLAESGGPWTFPHFYGDPATGFLRNASWFVSYPGYWIASYLGATALYFVNGVVVIAIAGLAGFIAVRSLALPRPILIVVFISAFFAWPYTADLLVFPSLQEKTVILGAAGLLWWATAGFKYRSNWASILILVGLSVFAFTSKVQIILFVPGLLLLLLAQIRTTQNTSQRIRIVLAALTWLGASVVLLLLALVGTYSAGTAGASEFSLAISGPKALLFFVGLIYSVLIGLRLYFPKLQAAQRISMIELVPLIWILTVFVSGFLWDLRNYYLAIVALPFAMMAMIVTSWFRKFSFQIIVTLVILISSVMWLLFRLPAFFQATGSIRDLLDSQIGEQLDSEGAIVFVGCAEAPTHFNRYAELNGLESIVFKSENLSQLPSGPGIYFLSDMRLCPISGVELRERVWDSGARNSYVLYR